jgi:putative acetyltransferase
MIVREERPEDAAAVDAVLRDAFGDEGEVVVRLVAGIRASAEAIPGLALVAEDDSGIVGHTMLSWVGLEGGPRERLLVLTPMAVRGDRQRQGVGSQLAEALIALAEQAGEPLIVVEGVAEYYPRFGFERASALGIERPHEKIPDVAFMVRRLAAYDPAIRGRVVYPAAFDFLYEP